MNLYDMALQIFLKRSTGGFVNDSTKPGFVSEMKAAIELAELFATVREEHRKGKPKKGSDIPIPGSEL